MPRLGTPSLMQRNGQLAGHHRAHAVPEESEWQIKVGLERRQERIHERIDTGMRRLSPAGLAARKLHRTNLELGR